MTAQLAAGAPVHYPTLDTVRAALALAVLLFHLSGTIALPKYFGVDGPALIFGAAGARVPFFFVLSGFLLAHLHAADVGRPLRAWAFLRRRALRIYPTYWIILLIVIVGAQTVPDLRARLPDDPVVLLKTFALVVQDPSVAGATGAPIIVAAWTLHYELAFYLLVAAFIVHRGLGVALMLVLGLAAWQCADGHCGLVRRFLASPHLAHFVFGAAAAYVARALPPWPGAARAALLVLVAYGGLAVVSGAGTVSAQAADADLPFVLLASVALVLLANADAQRRERPHWPWTRRLSDASYALYLLHFPVISLLCRAGVELGLQGAFGAWLAFVAIAWVCVRLALVFHAHVERPLLLRLR